MAAHHPHQEGPSLDLLSQVCVLSGGSCSEGEGLCQSAPSREPPKWGDRLKPTEGLFQKLGSEHFQLPG